MEVICISGKARHGKDTAGQMIKDILVEEGYDESRILITHFADLLKYIVKEFWQWNGEKDEAGRTLLQYVGTHIIREKQPDYWVDFLIGILNFFPHRWDYVIIPDCRFPNEAQRFVDEGFTTYLLRIVRDGFESDLSNAAKADESETAMDDFLCGYLIHNTTRENLKEELKGLDFLNFSSEETK